MARFGVIQNEEVLQEVLNSERVFFIPCKDKADAHSKAVSLNNAKNRMSLAQQRKLRIQRAEDGGEWGVRVCPASKIVIWEIVDGVKVQWNPYEGKLSEDNQRMFELMLKDKVPLDEIIKTLSDEKEELVRKAYTEAVGVQEAQK